MKSTAPINCISPSLECDASDGCFARTYPRSGSRRGTVSSGVRCAGTDPLPTASWGVLELGGRGLGALLAVGVCITGGAHAETADLPPGHLVGAHQQALSILKSLPRQWAGSSTYDCKTYEDENIDKLAMSFAVLSIIING